MPAVQQLFILFLAALIAAAAAFRLRRRALLARRSNRIAPWPMPHEYETQRADELARSNAMILARSRVAACLDTTSEPTQVFETLGSELEKAGLQCMIGTLDAEGQNLKIEYLSIQPQVRRLSDQLRNLWPQHVVVPRRLWPSERAVVDRMPYWDAEIKERTLAEAHILSNALKYALPDGRPGTLRIDLRACPNRILQLRVADDGAGLPPDFDIRAPSTLGLQLVSSLVAQLGGRLDVEPAAGVAFQVSFTY
jgi:hypothetical protein